MSQGSQRQQWPRQQVDDRLRAIMRAIHEQAWSAAQEFGQPGNYVLGANIAGFLKVADAMLDQAVVLRPAIDASRPGRFAPGLERAILVACGESAFSWRSQLRLSWRGVHPDSPRPPLAAARRP
jgi:hypothetical protein